MPRMPVAIVDFTAVAFEDAEDIGGRVTTSTKSPLFDVVWELYQNGQAKSVTVKSEDEARYVVNQANRAATQLTTWGETQSPVVRVGCKTRVEIGEMVGTGRNKKFVATADGAEVPGHPVYRVTIQGAERKAFGTRTRRTDITGDATTEIPTSTETGF